MAHYQAVFLNHLKRINSCLRDRNATANISLPGGVLQIQWQNRVYDFQPQFIVNKPDIGIEMRFQLDQGSNAFAGWLPYCNKRWLEAYSKNAFKEFAKKYGIRTPEYHVTQKICGDVVIKKDRSSFAVGMRGPFRETSPDVLETCLNEGEYYEQFVFGKNMKAWFWNGNPVCVEIEEMAYVLGDGRRTVMELIAPKLEGIMRPVPNDLIKCMAEYQGKHLDSVLKEGEKLYVDYRYGSPLCTVHRKNRNILHKVSASLRQQLDVAGRTFEQSIPANIRPNTVFTADGIVDEQDRIWFLEINCNPGLHPDVYPAMLESLFADADMIPDSCKPLHLQKPLHLAQVAPDAAPIAISNDLAAKPEKLLPAQALNQKRVR